MKEEDKSKLVEVFTGSPWEAELVKSLLGNSDIEAVTKDGMVVNVVPVSYTHLKLPTICSV